MRYPVSAAATKNAWWWIHRRVVAPISGGALLLRAATDAGTYYVANRSHAVRHGTINITHPKRQRTRNY